MQPEHSLVVVITGATAGVGRAVAQRFAEDGARIALLARNPERLDNTARELQACGAHVLPISVDVAHAEEVFAAAERVERELGPIDIWINNAMTTVFGPAESLAPEEFERVTDVTYHGYVWGTLAALRAMRRRGRGTIVQVGSALAYRAIPLQAAYCGAKHAIRAFTDSLRSELLHDAVDIKLTMVQLPGLNTPQFTWCENKLGRAAQPVPPIFQPEIAARAIHYAAHHPRREAFVGGPTIKAILGQKVMPGLLDRFLAGKGYRGQLMKRADPPGRASNLFAPVPGTFGAHGEFDNRARRHDPVTTVAMRLGAAGVQAIAAVVAVALLAGTLRAVARRI